MFKKLFLLLVVVLIVIQFFRPEKNIHAGTHANNITKVIAVPSEVGKILKTSCYDCHSNNTEYPWYASVQPVAWWLNHHIEEGKKEVNFDEFANYLVRRQYKKLEEINEQVKEDEMPLGSYTLIHKDAVLSKDQKLAIANWVTGAMDNLKSRYPADSFLKK